MNIRKFEYKESEVFCGIIVIVELSRTPWSPPPENKGLPESQKSRLKQLMIRES